MFEGYNSLIAGVMNCQKLLVLHLEEQGVIPKGSFREALEKGLASMSPAQSEDMMHEPIRLLIKALSKAETGRKA